MKKRFSKFLFIFGSSSRTWIAAASAVITAALLVGCGGHDDSKDGPATYTVTFITDGTPGATLTGTLTQTIKHGSDCTPVTAVPPADSDFGKWTLADSSVYSMENQITVTAVTSDITLTANFWGVVYVDADATGNNDGTSWTDAFTDLEAALSSVVSGAVIWVAEGTYKPASDHGLGIGDRGRHFQLKNDVAVYGGFAGGETSRDQRLPSTHPTVLSGDIGVGGDDSDNCYHVFRHSGVPLLDGTAVLDGFTVTGGRADDTINWLEIYGGGMMNGGSPTVRNCVFASNWALECGGAMGNFNNSRPTVTNCTFVSNWAATTGSGIYNDNSSPVVKNCDFISNYGTAVVNNSGSSPVVTGCLFMDNWDRGITNYESNATVSNCTFMFNSAASGGAVYNNGWGDPFSPIFTNCMFFANQATDYGGAMCNEGYCSPVVTNCTFALNSAGDSGGAIFNMLFESFPTVTNCVLWNDTAAISGNEVYNDTLDMSVLTFSHCDIDGCGGSGAGWDPALDTDGGGNIDDDPLFVNVPGRVDLTSAAGTTATVEIASATVHYSVNDVIEVNADNVIRTVTDVTGTTVTFTPTLAVASEAGDIVANWGPGATDLVVDLSLADSSPCVDTGDDDALPADPADLDSDGDTSEQTPFDLDGNDRVSGSHVDMGAYEYQQ